MGAFKEPHGGKLQELYLNESAAEQEKRAARDYPSWNLTDRQLCDLQDKGTSVGAEIQRLPVASPRQHVWRGSFRLENDAGEPGIGKVANTFDDEPLFSGGGECGTCDGPARKDEG